MGTITMSQTVSRGRGFTLVELLIVVAIIAILMGIGLPSYQDYMRKAARSGAKGAMLDLAQNEERYFTANGIYLAVGVPPAVPPTGWLTYDGANINSRWDTASGKYQIQVTGLQMNPATCTSTGAADLTTGFLITATTVNGFEDTACATMMVDSRGVKCPAACW